jgi:hypothetical protein
MILKYLEIKLIQIQQDKTAIDINLGQYLREQMLWIRSPLHF